MFINILQLASLALVVYPMINDVFEHPFLVVITGFFTANQSVSQVSALILGHSEFELVKIAAFLFRMFF